MCKEVLLMLINGKIKARISSRFNIHLLRKFIVWEFPCEEKLTEPTIVWQWIVIRLFWDINGWELIAKRLSVVFQLIGNRLLAY